MFWAWVPQGQAAQSGASSRGGGAPIRWRVLPSGALPPRVGRYEGRPPEAGRSRAAGRADQGTSRRVGVPGPRVLLPAVPAGVRRDGAGVAGAGRGASVDWLNSAADPLNSEGLPGNPLGMRYVFCHVRSQTLTGGAVAALHRRGAGRWSVPVAAIVAVVLALGVCAALVVNRIDDGTAAVGGASFVVASAHTVSSIAGSSIAGPTAANR